MSSVKKKGPKVGNIKVGFCEHTQKEVLQQFTTTGWLCLHGDDEDKEVAEFKLKEERKEYRPNFLTVIENNLRDCNVVGIFLFTNIKRFAEYLTTRFSLSMEETLYINEEGYALIYPSNEYGTRVRTKSMDEDEYPRNAVDFDCVDNIMDLRVRFDIDEDEKLYQEFLKSVEVLVENMSENPDDYPDHVLHKLVMDNMEIASKYLDNEKEKKGEL